MTVSALQNTETPSNTIAQRIRKLAADGFGHEDIVALLRADGLKISAKGRARIREIVLKRTTASLRGTERGRKAAV
jgi:hypothetical protein